MKLEPLIVPRKTNSLIIMLLRICWHNWVIGSKYFTYYLFIGIIHYSLLFPHFSVSRLYFGNLLLSIIAKTKYIDITLSFAICCLICDVITPLTLDWVPFKRIMEFNTFYQLLKKNKNFKIFIDKKTCVAIRFCFSWMCKKFVWNENIYYWVFFERSRYFRKIEMSLNKNIKIKLLNM